MADSHFVEAELARTGRSTCRGCKQLIEKGALRIADSYEQDHFQSHPWHHADCFNKLSKRHIDLEVGKIHGYDTLSKEDQKIVKGIIEGLQQNMRLGKKPPKEKKTVQKAAEREEKVDKEAKDDKEPAKKTKKAKPKSKKGDSEGLTAKQLKLFEEYCEEYQAMGANELKEILALNNQPKTGNKTELAERCADGKLLGRTPSCSECGGGKLRFNRTNGIYNCPGYMDDSDFKRCGRNFNRKEITRSEWKES